MIKINYEKDEIREMGKKTEKTQAELYREQRKARLAKAAAKKNKKANRVTMSKGAKAAIAIIIVVALAGGIAGFAVSNSGVKYRKAAALSIGGDVGTVSAAEYSFYYRTIFNNYFEYAYQYDSQYGQGYGAMVTGGFDYTKSPDEQSYSGELEGYENPTWADFFDYTVRTQIVNIKAFAKLAAEKGLTLDEDEIKTIDDQINSVKETASKNNYSLGAYLKASYGDGVSKGLFRKILEEQSLASKYQEVMTEEFAGKLSESDIEKEYKKDTDAYDKVGLAYYLVKAETEKAKDNDGNESEKVTDATMKKAKATADKLAESKDLDSLSKAVDKVAGADDSLTKLPVTSKESITQSIDESIAEWIYGKGVNKGDTKVFESENTGYYVCMVLDTPYREERNTIDVRHILINFTSDDSSSDDDSTTTAADDSANDESVPALDTFKDAPLHMSVTEEMAKDKEAYKKAELILRKYLSGDRTADSFAALATENSDDTGSQSNGGLYEDVAPGTMVSEFNDWCFDPSRKAGDVGIVETTYGYHIMYFVETNSDPEWKATIKSSLSSTDFEEYVEENITAEKYPVTVVKQSYVDKAIESTMKLAKRQIQSLTSSSTIS